MDTQGTENHAKLSASPISRAGRNACIGLVVVAIIVAVVAISVPIAVAVLAVGGLVLGE